MNTYRMNRSSVLSSLLLVYLGCWGIEAAESASGSGPPKLVAQTYNSGFELAHDTYNGLSCASDGKIYYVMSTESYEVGAQMFVFDPVTRLI